MDPRFIYAWKEFKVEKEKAKNRNILELNVTDKKHLESKLKASLLKKPKSILDFIVYFVRTIIRPHKTTLMS